MAEMTNGSGARVTVTFSMLMRAGATLFMALMTAATIGAFRVARSIDTEVIRLNQQIQYLRELETNHINQIERQFNEYRQDIADLSARVERNTDRITGRR